MKQILITLDVRTHRPIIELDGAWLGREVKLIMAHLPKAYRLSKAEMLKEIEGQSMEKEDDRTSECESEPRDLREVSKPKRAAKGKKRNRVTKRKVRKARSGTKADKRGKAGQQDESNLLRTDEGTEAATEGSEDPLCESSSSDTEVI